MSREPVALPGLITAAITSTLGVLVLFGVDLSAEQIGGIVTALGGWIAVATFFMRAQVTPLADPRAANGEQLVAASSALTDVDARALEARLLEQSDNRPHDGDPAQPEEGTGADS